MHIYMTPQFNICCMSRYTISDHFNPKHNITKSMVRPWPLAPHQDYLQYMYHVYLMQAGSKPGCYKKSIKWSSKNITQVSLTSKIKHQWIQLQKITELLQNKKYGLQKAIYAIFHITSTLHSLHDLYRVC